MEPPVQVPLHRPARPHPMVVTTNAHFQTGRGASPGNGSRMGRDSTPLGESVMLSNAGSGNLGIGARGL